MKMLDVCVKMWSWTSCFSFRSPGGWAAFLIVAACACGQTVAVGAAPARSGIDRESLLAAGVTGGLVVRIGCETPQRLPDLRLSDSCIVQGLDTNREEVEKARRFLAERGLLGGVSVDSFDGELLPYISNSVNAVVVKAGSRMAPEELERALAPGGIALVEQRDNRRLLTGLAGRTPSSVSGFTRFTKVRPADMDPWTHFLHDPQGTMVGKDRIVGPPERLQWVAGPKWLRSHEFVTSMHGLVASENRIFYVIDEGLRNHLYLPARWKLIARDAFNGTMLWKKNVKDWWPHTWPLKSGPAFMSRRVVSAGDRLYATLGFFEPLTQLEAATGKVLRTYSETKATEEIIHEGGILYLLVDPDKKPMNYGTMNKGCWNERDAASNKFGWTPEKPERMVMAVRADSGKVLWKRRDKIAPLSITSGGGNIFYFDGSGIVALDRTTGRRAWRTEVETNAPRKIKAYVGYIPRVVFSENILLFADRNKVSALAPDSGKLLWQNRLHGTGHFSPFDLFAVDGLVWSLNTGGRQKGGTSAIKALDLKTGEVKKDFQAEGIDAFFMHQRCYPGRATERYMITSGTGTEFHEFGSDSVQLHHHVRGNCVYGVMPANGLLYKPPDSCACYYQSKIVDLCALAAGSRPELRRDSLPQLEKGAAYSSGPTTASVSDRDWPVFRHDNERSGFTKCPAPAELNSQWQTEIGGKISQPVAVGDRIFLSAVDEHTIHCLDAGTGKSVWSFPAGGRVDSPPTFYRGLLLFGSADGWVYCLTADDGKLAWRYRVAPGIDKLVSYEQIESVWPLHGSALVQNDTLYCLAGRNMMVDGGLRLVKLDPVTGEKLAETVMGRNDPDTGENLQTLMAKKSIPVTKPDILSCDGRNIYMRAQKIDFSGKRVDIAVKARKEFDQLGQGRHLFCPTGFLDDCWFHRSFWIYGKNAGEGWGEYYKPQKKTPQGRIMAFDDEKVYVSHCTNIGHAMLPRDQYFIYAIDRHEPDEKAAKNRKEKRDMVQIDPFNTHWQIDSPGLLANAMVRAGDNLVVAGPPDVADETKMFGFVSGAADEINRELQEQEAAWKGEHGGVICVLDAENGERIAEARLSSVPGFDGMIVAGGKVVISMIDGSVVCLGD